MIKPHFLAGGPPKTPISYAKLGVKSREIEDPSQPHRVSAPHPPWGCMGSTLVEGHTRDFQPPQ